MRRYQHRIRSRSERPCRTHRPVMTWRRQPKRARFPLAKGDVRRTAPTSSTGRPDVEVIIGEIPDADDITVMRWTARCSDPEHDLLGTFDSEQEARHAKEEHLASQH